MTRTPILYYCSAGKTSLTINADGNIYACFMLMSEKGYCLGNVNKMRGNFGYPPLIIALLDESNKFHNSICCKCWAQSLCFGCIGEDIIREGQRVNRSINPRESVFCDFKRKMVEVFLKSVAEIYLYPQPQKQR